MHIEGLANLSPEGTGGFSQVFRAIETRYDRTVAAKVLNFRIDDPADQARFESECRAMAQLSDHPHIVPLYSTTYTDEGFPVIIMEFFAGGTLWSRAKRGAGLADMLDAGVKVASALHTAHERGVTHRDVKPQNVLMSRFSEPGLTDFGISAFDRYTAEYGRPSGITIAYAAPEAIDGVSNRRTDIYSLASTLYTVLADQRPYDLPGKRQSSGDLIRRIIGEDPPSLQQFGYSSTVDHAIRRTGMARSADDRPQTAAEFGELLQRLQRTEGLEITPFLQAHDRTDTSTPTELGDESQAVIHQPTSLTPPTPVILDDLATEDTGRRRIMAAVAGIGAVLILAAIALLARGGGDGDEDLAVVTPAPIATVDDDFFIIPLPPRDLTILREGDHARLDWQDPNTDPMTFEVQGVDNGRLVDPIVTSDQPSVVFNPLDEDCFVVRAIATDGRGRVSLDSGAVCLAPEDADLLVAVSPLTCSPGECDVTLDVGGAAPGTALMITVTDPDGNDPNERVASAYPTTVTVDEAGAIDWTFSPGSTAPEGSYVVSVVPSPTDEATDGTTTNADPVTALFVLTS